MIDSWDGKQDGAEKINMMNMQITEQYAKFYEFRLLEGELINDTDAEYMALINQSAARVFGWDKPVGKCFYDGNRTRTVKGVIKNIYNFAPTVWGQPFYYYKSYAKAYAVAYSGHDVLFKYREGTWKTCKEKIEQLLKTEYPDAGNKYVYNSEEEYDKYLKSENALLKILSFVSLVCVIICIFGFVSLVSLTCEERRKEIAIRKINGATMHNILSIFSREYFSLLVIGAVIAFPIVYYIMQQWLQKYIKRTDIPAWVYLSILFALVMVIVLCVGWRVYKASVENPAEVIKN
jgi:ABC-type antimicrobial peptide transport system permease subunit